MITKGKNNTIKLLKNYVQVGADLCEEQGQVVDSKFKLLHGSCFGEVTYQKSLQWTIQSNHYYIAIMQTKQNKTQRGNAQ